MAETDTPLAPRAEAASSGTRRHALLGGLAAAGGAAFPVPAEAKAAADPHPAWEREMLVNERRSRTLRLHDPLEQEAAQAALLDAWCSLSDRIGYTPARTAAGAAVQVRTALRTNRHSTLSDADVAGLENAAATLERLAREG